MSIADFINKIKRVREIDHFVFGYISILVFVSLAAFGLGRLSVADRVTALEGRDNQIKITPEIILTNSQNQLKSVSNLEKKMYLASKNGKLYYPVDCPGAKRIAEKNIIWFNTSAQAELSGYKLATSCQNK